MAAWGWSKPALASLDERELRMLEGLSQELPVHHHAMHAVRCNLLCAFYVSAGRYDACFPSGDQAIAHFRAFGSVFGEVFIYFHQGYACVQQARLRDAEALFLELAGRALATAPARVRC